MLTGTQTVYGYRYYHTNAQEIWLIDTPGFNDTNKANVQVLGDIASFLCTFCSNHNLIIGGVLYIHRITDIRMSNSSLKSLRIFEALCGDACFEDVTVVTTMWDMLHTQEAVQAAENREVTLQSRQDFFARLIQGGARYARHTDTRTSSIDIVENLVKRNRKVSLAMQKELQQNSTVTLVDTTVGKLIEGDLRDMRKKYETKIAQLEAYNNASGEPDGDIDLAVEHDKNLISKIDTDIDFLHLTFEHLRKECGIKMIEGARITANDTSLNNEDIESSTKVIEQQSSPLVNEATEPGIVDIRYSNTLDRTKVAIREKHVKDKPKKASSWLELLINSKHDPGKVMYHESRRSRSVPSEETGGRGPKVTHPKGLPQYRWRAEEILHPAQDVSYQASVLPVHNEQLATEDGQHRHLSCGETLSDPQQMTYNEYRSSPSDAFTEIRKFPTTIVWETSPLPRTYPNISRTTDTSSLRYSNWSTAEANGGFYSRAFTSD